MRVLLDEQLDWRLGRSFGALHEVQTVRLRGWSGLSNGELLREAAPEFDVFVTMDRNLPHQQPLSQVDLAVIVLTARSNRLEDTLPAMAELTRPLEQGVDMGRVYTVTIRD